MMLVAELQAEHVTFWWITLGMGLVVVIAVIVLLSLLVSFVKDIDQNLKDLWDTATRVAQNTSTTWMLHEADRRAQALLAEVKRHDEFLDSKLGVRAR